MGNPLVKKIGSEVPIFDSSPYRGAQLVKKLYKSLRILYNSGNGGIIMEQWRKDARSEAIVWCSSVKIKYKNAIDDESQ